MSEVAPVTRLETPPDSKLQALFDEVVALSSSDAAEKLSTLPECDALEVLARLNPALQQAILAELPREPREILLASAPPEYRRQWMANDRFPESTVGRLMEPPLAVFPPHTTIGEATERLRPLVSRAFITYLFVVDSSERLLGVVAMREMLLGEKAQPLSTIMIPQPFALSPEQDLVEAMKATMIRHFPVYPVVGADGKLVGTVRGQMLFEAQAIELSAQAGSMVGVEKEERLSTPWTRSLKFRHPWLQLNLITAFLAAAVVGVFEGTIDKFVALAVFQPVLAGQSGNTGCQALAVMLRGLTLGEVRGSWVPSVAKEALLGLCNGFLVGITSGIGMFFYALWRPTEGATPLALALITLAAMMGSCVISGIAGATVPIALKKLGADPATASSIFVTTATDVCSMGAFLGLATLMLM
jgi:magnesium transporter